MTRYVIVGGGILGLAVAHRLRTARPRDTVTVLEKESGWAAHQSGHNSGVIHAGVYYKPGSLKATLCRAGSASMLRFCAEQELPYEVCGKLIVAAEAGELPRLHALHERAVANGLPVTLLNAIEAAEYEPHVAAVSALRVASTGIADFGAVCRRLAHLLAESGAELRRNTTVTGIRGRAGGVLVNTSAGEVAGDVLVNCAGLHADRIARLAGIDPPARIVPFRGEYYELVPERRKLVRGLIYPVPDPQFPFLGVHLTRMIDGTVHAGPNAVLATAREGYSWRRFDPRDVWEQVGYSGLWALARRHYRYGLAEVTRSLSRKRFAASLGRLVPELTEADIVPAGAGVRAQAVRPDGGLVDDFLIVEAERQVHVLNAPSPAATSSFEIARHIVDRLPADR
ncbi:L-2-hydroxyglutarate oxidase [Plantactinospora sp. KLBMP9567]|uniref:L-2-hydroxyglutarate oxidase n=1 Tax=Plantactinospora sp. KLBMP9567 TaxID=3085900 RepID=UPI002980F9CF|nr:L-2-hydroxyglutarate oxidase [Plantactinospora sp. KLBMP9567]MDW5325442.1 L-2-hydroxyglutarate oxidase [Plantactinospora sp. KLBMP9567]